MTDAQEIPDIPRPSQLWKQLAAERFALLRHGADQLRFRPIEDLPDLLAQGIAHLRFPAAHVDSPILSERAHGT